MKFHVFWFAKFYPDGGLSDYAGSVDASSVDDARAFLFAQFCRSDRELDRYQISDEDLAILETGRLQHDKWLSGNKRANPTIHPDPSIFGMEPSGRFSTP
jgi:hypothetical protein